MRTTVTLDPDVAALLKNVMREREITFKEALNEAVRAGFGEHRKPRRFVQKTSDMGVPKVDLTKALQLAGQLEDEEIIRKMHLGK